MKEVTFKTDNRGKKRAYYFARQQFRWFPMPLKEAEGLIASGEAFFTPLHRTLLTPGGRAVSEGRHPESEGGTMAGADPSQNPAFAEFHRAQADMNVREATNWPPESKQYARHEKAARFHREMAKRIEGKGHAKHKGWCPDRIIAETASTCPCNIGGGGSLSFGEGGRMAGTPTSRWLFHINTHRYVDRSDPAHSREIVVEAPTAEEALGKLYAWRESAGELGPMIGTGAYKYVGMIHDQSEATTKRATQGMASANGPAFCRRRRAPSSHPWDRAVAMLDKARTMKQLNAAYEKARVYLLENTAGNEAAQIWCEYNSRIGNVTG